MQEGWLRGDRILYQPSLLLTGVFTVDGVLSACAATGVMSLLYKLESDRQGQIGSGYPSKVSRGTLQERCWCAVASGP
jgi:hypothetical protein